MTAMVQVSQTIAANPACKPSSVETRSSKNTQPHLPASPRHFSHSSYKQTGRGFHRSTKSPRPDNSVYPAGFPGDAFTSLPAHWFTHPFQIDP